jgi:DNA adenine methylase
VYCDPPYLPISATASFTGYTPGGFGLSDHRRLRDAARRLKEIGAHVLISNSAAPEIVELYRDGFEIIRVHAPRSIAGSGDSRGSVEELIIR